MTRAEKAIGADDGEAHRVLIAVSDSLCRRIALRRTEESGVGRDEERAVLRVDPEAVDVDRSGVLDLRRDIRRLGVLGWAVIAAAACEKREHQRRCCEQAKHEQSGYSGRGVA
jgi:hypothetical protein